jgi:multidrug efflux pump
MKLPGLCIARPVATVLLTSGIAAAGVLAFLLLPVSPLPQVDYPTISVQANMPGASPETMATAVATPLERYLGRIADVAEMTSSSSVGSTRVTVQFNLNRDIDGAARDVQAAIVAARTDLPTSLRSNPTYRKVNPADAPIMILSLVSSARTIGSVYDAATTVLQQRLSQVAGIGQVTLGGSSLPAVRVELNPNQLAGYRIGMEDVRAALAAANANTPKGAIEANDQRFQIATNDRADHAEAYRDLIIAWRDGAPVRLSNVAEVVDSVEDQRNLGLAGGEPAVLVLLFRQPNANIIETVDRVTELLPELQASIPADIAVGVVMDRTTTIRASLHDVERTLAIAIGLVVIVVYAFLRSVRATLIPCVVVPVSLLGTCSVMWLLGYSINNLSLMALIIATGFVVDDAVVVLENSMRHLESGTHPIRAALRGAREVGFTVLSMSLSLIAVFIPLLLMGGYVGRLFREFALVLCIAILISMVVSLTTTPMMCARLLRNRPAVVEGVSGDKNNELWENLLRWYGRTLDAALRHPVVTVLVLLLTIGVNVALFWSVPKGFFPQQDTGRVMGSITGDQATSFEAMQDKLAHFQRLVAEDPAVAGVVGFIGGGATNSGRIFMTLKPVAERDVSADKVIARLRPKLASVPGASLTLMSPQDIRIGGRPSDAQWQYTLQADSLDDLRLWTPKLVEALRSDPVIADVNTDQQEHGQELVVNIDRAAAARLHLTPAQVDNALYNAFGQRQVSTIYATLNQYHVVMEVDPRFRQNTDAVRALMLSTSGAALNGAQATNALAATTTAGHTANDPAANQRANQLGTSGRSSNTGSAVSRTAETMVPLLAVAHVGYATTPMSVNHQGHFAAATISFNLPPGRSLSDAVEAVRMASNRIGLPATIHGDFSGAASAFQKSLANQPWLILTAFIAIYIVLGILYESWIHPLTILSTLPSVGIGAVLALMLCGTEFSLIALIGVFLLIGIVKKNAIMMVDVAIDLERRQGHSPHAAIRAACLLRLRPILMTTLVALFSALPLALGHGDGAELRQPLGITIVGGLAVSQVLTLYTTPVVYLCLARLSAPRRPTMPTMLSSTAELAT